MNENEKLSFIINKIPDYAGYYSIGKGEYNIYFTNKPKWLHRKMMKICLGIEWIDEFKNK